MTVVRGFSGVVTEEEIDSAVQCDAADVTSANVQITSDNGDGQVCYYSQHDVDDSNVQPGMLQLSVHDGSFVQSYAADVTCANVHSVNVCKNVQLCSILWDHLFVDLLNQRTGACGTIRSNRFGFRKDLQGKKKMKKGEATFLHCDNLTAVRWFDKCDVYAISTLHGNEMVTIPPKNPSSEQITKPKLIVDYNENMNGVDRCDQLLVYYALNRKTTKWWKRLFFSFVGHGHYKFYDTVCKCLSRKC